MNKAILLVNLGSPASPSTRHVRAYLKEFLMDRHVLRLPYWLRWLIVHLVILPFRPKKTAAAYKKIWMAEGSPLLIYTEKFAAALRKAVNVPVYWTMRFGNPSIRQVLRQMAHDGVDQVLVAPLFPQHAAATIESSLEEAIRCVRTLPLTLQVMPVFYKNPAYLTLLTERVKAVAKEHDFVLFSYHGLPLAHITAGDPTGAHCLKSVDCCQTSSLAHETCYRHQAFFITRQVALAAGLSERKYTTVFQSRVGRGEWLGPNASDFLERLPQTGVTSVAVIAPSFVADNLETLEEIDIRMRERFLAQGGKKFTYIPCFNDEAPWVKAFAKLVQGYL